MVGRTLLTNDFLCYILSDFFAHTGLVDTIISYLIGLSATMMSSAAGSVLHLLKIVFFLAKRSVSPVTIIY